MRSLREHEVHAGLKTPCYIEAKAASSGLGAAEFRTLQEFGTLLKQDVRYISKG